MFLQQTTSTGVHIFLEDTSGNGTFINGEKVGKCLKVLLWTISLFTPAEHFSAVHNNELKSPLL